MQRVIFTAILFSLIFTPGSHAGQKDIPGLFIIGGFKGREIYSDVYSISVFDLLKGENAVWNRAAPLPEALQGHTAVAAGNHIIVIGGLEGFAENGMAAYSRDVYSAEAGDTCLGEWKREKPLPHPLGYHAAATYKDFIIISGGQTPATIPTVYKTAVSENGELSGWEAAGDLPKPARGHASIMVEDRLFILGGHDDKGFFADVFSAQVDRNGEIGEWERATPLPLPMVHFGAAGHDGRIYIFGGQDADDNLHTEVYSTKVTGSKLGEWRKEEPFPVPQSRMAINIMDKRIISTGGGFGWEPPVYSDVFTSEIGEDGMLGKWKKIGDLPGQIAFHAAVTALKKQVDSSEPAGPYLGQKPPGVSPEAFAPEIIFSKNAVHGSIAFYPDGKEIYWIFHSEKYGQDPPLINFIKQVDGRWTKPGILEFSKEYGAISMCISPDGKKLFFNSKRPWPDSWGRQPSGNALEAYKVWYVERAGAGWGEPIPLDRRINRNLMGVSSTTDGTLYTHGIKRIKIENGQYAEWEQLGYPLDVGRILGGNPYIDPDERYVLFNKKWPGRFGYGIFISYRTRDDRWTEPVNLLERLNTPRGGSQPVVTPDNRYLFYYSGGEFFWVDAKIIEDLRPKELK